MLRLGHRTGVAGATLCEVPSVWTAQPAFVVLQPAIGGQARKELLGA
jgi:hypothetical protein